MGVYHSNLFFVILLLLKTDALAVFSCTHRLLKVNGNSIKPSGAIINLSGEILNLVPGFPIKVENLPRKVNNSPKAPLELIMAPFNFNN